MHQLKELISGPVSFDHYRDGQLWYTTHNGFEFPVPIDDTGTGVFKNTDKGILFMRWIRKHFEMVEAERKVNEFRNGSY